VSDAAAAACRHLLGLWQLIVDQKVGIVRDIVEFAPDADEPNFFYYLSTACNTFAFSEAANSRQNGGAAIDRYRALAKALGEAVERYCSAMTGNQSLLLASHEQLPGPAPAPESFALFSKSQYSDPRFPWRPFRRDTRLRWVCGTSLVTGMQLWVPAAMVFVPYRLAPGSPEAPIVQSISTGLACGSSFAAAALSGLYEVIERDAVTLTWQAGLSRPRLDVATAPGSVQDAIARFSAAEVHVELIDVTTDVAVPTVLSIAIGDAPSSPAVAVAGAADDRIEVAALRSIEELALTRKFARRVQHSLPAVRVDVANDHPDVADQRHHIGFYCPQSAKPFIAFLWASQDVRNFRAVDGNDERSDQQRLDAAVQTVARAGYDVIAVDVTTADVAVLGLHVVRMLVPGLHPLFIGHQLRARGGDRLYGVPQKLGFPGMLRDGPDNRYPHPMP
jgi:ribosomal protein S12 methylthiotransferase accessory factor